MPNLHALPSVAVRVGTFFLGSAALLVSPDLAYGQAAPGGAVPVGSVPAGQASSSAPSNSIGQVPSGSQVLSGGAVFSGGQTTPGGYAGDTPGSVISPTSGPGSSTAGISQTLAVPVITATPPRQIGLRASAAVSYDSNVARINDLRPLLPGATKADFYFPLGAFVNVVVPTGRNVFSLTGAVTYNVYARDTYLTSEDINLTAGYRRDLHPCTVDVDGTYRRGRTDFSNTDVLDFNKNLETTATVAGTLSCATASGFRPYVSVNYSVARNSQFIRRLNDHDTVVYGTGVTYTAPSIGTLGIIGSISQNLYTSRPLSGIFGAHEVHVKSIGGSFQRNTARILQAALQLNYTIVDRTVTSKGFHGLSGTASIQFVPGGRFVFSGQASRSVQTSLGYNADYIVETDYSLTATAAISPRLRASLIVSRQHQAYQGVIAPSGHALTSDADRQFGGDAVYALSPRISLTVSATYHDRSANDRIYNYSGMRLSAGASVRI